ncbi:MAG: hypothetical protein Q9169_008298, partial [Polycauliona sp. 2 TL-2023]
KHFDIKTLQFSEKIAGSDVSLQEIIKALADGKTSVTAILQHEHEQTRQHAASQFDSLRQHHRYQEVKDSLFYPEIFARQEQIERLFDGIKDSYQWIYTSPSGTANSKILSECPSLVGCLQSEPLYTWTESRLLSTLESLLTQNEVPISICMFIDGLDEFTGDYGLVLKTMTHLFDRANVKCCISSRPLNAFQIAFGGMPSLSLQHLTFESIEQYAFFLISPLIEQRLSHHNDDVQRAKHMLFRIAERAEGVFLWAVIIVRKLRAGLEDLVDLDELERDIKSVPDDVEKLYHHMLTQIKPAYQKDAIRFLLLVVYEQQYAFESSQLDLYRLCFIDMERCSGDLSLKIDQITFEKTSLACDRLETRLRSHTMGLLDIDRPQDIHGFLAINGLYKGIDEQVRDKCPNIFKKVYVFHRTIKDFLLKSEMAKPLFQLAGEEWHLRLAIARGTLCHLSHVVQNTLQILEGPFLPHYDLLETAMKQITRVESLVQAAQSQLMRSLSYFAFVPRSSLFPSELFYYGKRIIPEGYRPLTYVIPTGDNPLVDFVGLAARCGMTLYVCQILGFSQAQSSPHDIRLVRNWKLSPDDQDLGEEEEKIRDQKLVPWLYMHVPADAGMDYNHYRHQMQKFLRQRAHSQTPERADYVSEEKSLETYLLACIRFRPYSSGFTDDNDIAGPLALVEILLDAGASPMVLFRCPNITQRAHSFWDTWLYFLDSLEETDAKPGRQNDYSHVDRKRLQDLYYITKHLIDRGANINYVGAWAIDFVHVQINPRSPNSNIIRVETKHRAMYTIKRVFHREPEFQQFSVAVDPSGRRRWRYITTIGAYEYQIVGMKPTQEEQAVLWPLIEAFEASRKSLHDKEELADALRKILRTHRPHIDFGDDDEDNRLIESFVDIHDA